MKQSNTSLMVVALLLSAPLSAAEFCATTSQQLSDALSTANSNNQNDTIRIAAGHYNAPLLGFVYAGLQDDHLTVSGGWTEFFNNPCGIQSGVNAALTVLDGQHQQPVLRLHGHGNAGLDLSNLTVQNGFRSPQAGGNGGGLLISSFLDFVGNVRIRHVAFLDNAATAGAALYIERGDHLTVRNAVFADNVAAAGSAVEIRMADGFGVHFNNNTVLNNLSGSSDPAVADGVFIEVAGNAQQYVANNLLWNNGAVDLAMAGSGVRHLYNNDIGVFQGTPDHAGDNLSVAPELSGSSPPFRPLVTSPLRNAGRMPIPITPIPLPFTFAWGLDEFDLTGADRVIEDVVDIGAYEAWPAPDLIFADDFDPIIN